MQSDDYYYVRPNQALQSIPQSVQHIFFCQQKCAVTILDLSLTELQQLQTLTICRNSFTDNCFKFIIASTIIGVLNNPIDIPSLLTVIIDDNSFDRTNTFIVHDMKSLTSIQIHDRVFDWQRRKSKKGFCQVYNCPNLLQMKIGHYCFVEYRSFEISNVDSLQAIEFGNQSFQFTNFSLKGEL